MGNDVGRGTSNRMALAAMANATKFGKPELLKLQQHLKETARKEGDATTITRAEFRETMTQAGIIEADLEVLDRLFTMFDRTGNDNINYREFLVGLAPLCQGTAEEKLQFALELYDADESWNIGLQDLQRVLLAINETASYFGDPVLKRDEVQRLAEDIFKQANISSEQALSYTEFVPTIVKMPAATVFVSGQGSVRYGSGA